MRGIIIKYKLLLYIYKCSWHASSIQYQIFPSYSWNGQTVFCFPRCIFARCSHTSSFLGRVACKLDARVHTASDSDSPKRLQLRAIPWKETEVFFSRRQTDGQTDYCWWGTCEKSRTAIKRPSNCLLVRRRRAAVQSFSALCPLLALLCRFYRHLKHSRRTRGEKELKNCVLAMAIRAAVGQVPRLAASEGSLLYGQHATILPIINGEAD